MAAVLENISKAILQVMVVVFFGALLAKMGYFNMDKQRWLSKLNLVFFTPCLLFSNIASIISFQKLLAFWPIPMIYLVFAFMNYASSQLASRMIGLNPAYRRFVTACVMFSNSNSVPIAVITSLAVSDAVNTLYWTPDDTAESVSARGISYTLFFAIFGNLIRWSYGYQLLQKQPEDDTCTILEDEEDNIRNNKSYQSFPQASSSSSSISVDRISSGNESSATAKLDESTSLLHGKSKPVWKTVLQRINSLMSPPLYAAVVALIVGLSPLKSLLYNKQSFLYPSFTKAVESCGKAAVPLILSCLGAQLVDISQSQNQTSVEMRKPIALAIILRMVLTPFIVLPLAALFVQYAQSWSSLASDPVFVTMMIILGCTPTAINLVQITQVNNIFEEEMLRMLFWSYGVICVPVCTLLVFLALSLVEKML